MLDGFVRCWAVILGLNGHFRMSSSRGGGRKELLLNMIAAVIAFLAAVIILLAAVIGFLATVI